MDPRAYIHLRLLILAVGAGRIDAASFLDFDQVFTANQTGNTVLLGVALDGAAIAVGAGIVALSPVLGLVAARRVRSRV